MLCRSSLMALNGIYRFLYYYLMKKIPVQDVPSGLEDDVFDLPGVELGKYALQLPPPATTDSNHDAPPLNHRGISQADSSRQTFEMQPFEKQPLMQEMSSRLEGVEFQLNDNSIRFASRLNEIETKVEGILQALKIGLSKENGPEWKRPSIPNELAPYRGRSSSRVITGGLEAVFDAET